MVRINDRGPYIKGRIIDLTPAGAPFFGFVTVSTVPSGHVRPAAVLPLASKRSPLAVRLPDE
jgi:rare lipoprotein A (peptidoglycan hydrolase)